MDRLTRIKGMPGFFDPGFFSEGLVVGKIRSKAQTKKRFN